MAYRRSGVREWLAIPIRARMYNDCNRTDCPCDVASTQGRGKSQLRCEVQNKYTCKTCGKFFFYSNHSRQNTFCSRPCYKEYQASSTHFWERVDKSGGPDACWPWLASTNNGYGQARLPGHGRYRLIHASRAAYILSFGAISDDLCVCHRCDNRICCNPAHLFLGTLADNNADMRQKGHSSGGSLPGIRNPTHKLSDEAILDIRARYAAGEYQINIAAAYGVHQTLISAIVRRVRWKHV